MFFIHIYLFNKEMIKSIIKLFIIDKIVYHDYMNNLHKMSLNNVNFESI